MSTQIATTVPFVDLRAQFAELRDEVLPRMAEVVESASFVLGPHVQAFERQFAAFVGCEHAIGVSSGTSALAIALRAVGVGAGDEVIVPANTFIASALAVSQVGAIPVLVDVDERLLMDPAAAAAAVTPKTKAIVPVHLFGQAVAMDAVVALAQQHQLKIVEDACQAHGALYKGRPVGAIGDAGCFSFYPGKNLGAYGDGGAVVTNDPDIAAYVATFRDVGQRHKYDHTLLGDNARLDALQAAVLSVKLPRLAGWNAKRRAAAAFYRRSFSAAGIEMPAVDASPEAHVYHLFVIEVDHRDAVRAYLSDHGVSSGIHYPVPVHLQPAYKFLNLAQGSFPRTERAAERMISLPMYPEISEEQLQHVATTVREAVEGAGI